MTEPEMLAARPVTVAGLAIGDARVRILGELAIIHACTQCRAAMGEARSGRQADVRARRYGKWLGVAADVTR